MDEIKSRDTCSGNMPLGSRPVKVACLGCRASKIRCDLKKPCASCTINHEECRYLPSQRGGARRGPLAAEELAKRPAQRLVNNGGVDNGATVVNSPGFYLHSHPSTAVPFPLSSPSPIELDPRPCSTSLEDSGLGLPLPLSGFRDPQELVGAVEPSLWTIRAYRCDQDLMNAYYIFIHPYFPCLPPPAVPQYEDKYEAFGIRSPEPNTSSLPYWPTSPLSLALAAILALIPPGKSLATDYDSIEPRKSYSELYARSALESCEDSLESPSRVDPAKGPQSTLHPAILQKVEPVLALDLLSLYECCHRGNIPKMRFRANQALTIAMDDWGTPDRYPRRSPTHNSFSRVSRLPRAMATSSKCTRPHFSAAAE
ncbi:hypothetical protein BO71DRAFT_15851 [Aspergillus ellipticus CBS 707.79]|uniref:Zn(2)-C6 fungal-type domain-containing protein n=1 Tax=Aspergillus ellipticus CBS 707.79 TaxID=1448320 RepID=A0A319D6P7_9EURO|nr:hypothetical protein BO71DRAFT_15851 [Aspergillus ellipticus CBS 707.79]